MSFASSYRGPVRLRRFPLLPVVLCFAVGIGIWRWWPTEIETWHTLAIGLFLLALIALARRAAGVARRGAWLTFGILLFFVGLGYWRVGISHPLHQDCYFVSQDSSQDESLATYALEIENIRAGDRHLRLLTRVVGRVDTAAAQTAVGRLLLYLPPTQRAARLLPGSRILVRGRARRISGPANPYAFDGADHWASQRTYYRMYLSNDDSWAEQRTPAFRPAQLARRLRDGWERAFQDHLPTDELAVATALILGKKDLLTADIRSAYTDTGAIHVLAVSGLHIGIVSLLFGWLLRPLARRLRGGKYVVTILTISGIWAFAFLTGLSPSVQRAALMFSFLELGRLGSRRAHLFNALAAAALCLLVFEPLQLFRPGFQLSFAAVAGIGLFQRRLEELVYPPAAVLRKIWAALTVSLAATLGTLPFTLLYFHQFPLYFLLTGSLVVVTAFAVMIAGILHGLLWLLLPKGAILSGWLLRLTVGFQNGIVFWGQQLPGARQETAWIAPGQFALLLLAIVTAGWWLKRRNFSAAAITLGALGLFFFFGYRSSKLLDRQHGVVAFHLSGKGRLVDVLHGRRALRLADEDLDPEQIRFAAGNFRSARGYEIDTVLTLDAATERYRLPYAAYDPPFLLTARGVGALPQTIGGTTPLNPRMPGAVDFLMLPTGQSPLDINLPEWVDSQTVVIHQKPPWTMFKTAPEVIPKNWHNLYEQGAFALGLHGW